MDSDAIISSALDIYADESTMKSEYGDVLEINTDNENIKQILHNLFYDILNIEFNLWPWVRNMCKYGDFFLQLQIDEKYGITNVIPLSVYDVCPDVVDTDMIKGMWEGLPKLKADEVADAVRYCFESSFNINKIVIQKNVS